jgi:hypothetical protein
MTNGDEPLETEHVSDADDISGEFLEGIRLDLMRFVRLAITSNVVGDRLKSRSGEDGELVSPAVPALRPAVAKDDQRAITLHGKPKPHTIGDNGSKFQLSENVDFNGDAQ